jgi:hypothetical protein
LPGDDFEVVRAFSGGRAQD